MPVFIKPARVTIDEGGNPLAAIAGVIVLAAIISGAAALIADLLTAILIALAVAVAGSLAVLVIVLRRSGLGLGQRPAPLEARPAAAIPQPERPAIRPARIVLHGQVVQTSPTERKTP